GRHDLLAQRSPGHPGIEIAAERRHREGENYGRQSGRNAGHRFHAHVHGLEAGARADGAHAKLAASSMLPEPLYCATSGYGHSGRVRTAFPSSTRDPRLDAGAVPFSTQVTSGVNASNVLTPTPPPQWNMPGTMNSR